MKVENSSKILVIGSSNTDLIVTVEEFPKAGETIRGTSFNQVMGGKGANQAMAACRLGGNVEFITSLGDDPNSKNATKYFEKAGLDISQSNFITDTPMGVALITVNEEGENNIVIIAGANGLLSPSVVEKVSEEIAQADYLLMQMEIPYESVRTACKIAQKSGTKVILNAAPATQLPPELLEMIDFLIVNETEIETITQRRIEGKNEEALMKSIISNGVDSVILTLGEKGCYFMSKTTFNFVSSFSVTAVDSTAAGDVFCGAFVTQLSKGTEIVEALKYASAAAAISVTRKGAQTSIPNSEEVLKFHTVLNLQNEST